MNPDFKHIMSKRTDEELVNIVFFDRDGYQPEGVKAAEGEIESRNISEEPIEQIKANWLEKNTTLEMIGLNKVGLQTRLINYLMIDKVAHIITAYMLITLFADLNVTFSLVNNETAIKAIVYFIYFGTFLAYYASMEIVYQKTIGKFITKTSVANLDGTKPSSGAIINRSLFRLIPFNKLSFLFAERGFHDNLSKTTVVKDVNNQANNES